MKPNDYNFKVGDKVITIYGEVGRITEICTCESCAKRGFYEPTWVNDSGDERWISVYDARRGFDGFYQIGEYRFNHSFDKDQVLCMIAQYEDDLTQLRAQVKIIEELEKGNEA